MINFFRKIRQNLLNENKFSKYLIYAVGEIILVVIGILIALQINNWNNNNTERRLESDMLNEILVNLESDSQNLEIATKENYRFEKNNKLVYEHLKNKTPLTDSLKHYYSYLWGAGTFQPIKSGYENLKSRGLNIIKNKTLRKEISELYENKYYYIVEDIRLTVETIETIHSNQLNANLITESSYVSAQPVNLKALQNDLQFQETLKSIVFARQWTNWKYEEGKNEIIKVKKAIESELSRN